MADLKFNMEQIAEAQRKVSEKRDDIDRLQKDLESALENLRSDWQTDAGKEFFNEDFETWTKSAEKYKTALDVLASLLEAANRQYEMITERASQIKIE